VYYCSTCSDLESGDAIYWCKSCKESTEHDHKRSKLKGAVGVPGEVDKDNMTEQQKTDYLDSLFDEYHQLDYEDVIGGNVLTRFKYTQVK